MPDAPGPPLVELRLEGRQDDPWAQRVLPDGAVWEHSSVETRVVDGQVVQSRVPLEWRPVTRIDRDGLDMIETRLRDGFFDLDAEYRPARTTTGRGLVIWRAALDGREHEVRLAGADPADVPLVAALDDALQLAIAMALDRESERAPGDAPPA